MSTLHTISPGRVTAPSSFCAQGKPAIVPLFPIRFRLILGVLQVVGLQFIHDQPTTILMPRLPQLTKEGEARCRTGPSAPSGTCAETSGSSEPENAYCEPPPAMLVVEEDEGDFMLLERALYKVGATARVWWSREPGDALSILEELQRSSAPVCVVMEVRLGACDGMGLARPAQSAFYTAAKMRSANGPGR